MCSSRPGLLLRASLAVVLAVAGVAQGPSHGTLVGSLTPTSALVWTRSTQDAVVTIHYATRIDFRDVRESAAVKAGGPTDYCVKVQLAGLLPATRYYYAARFRDPHGSFDVFGPVSEFSTPPDAATPQPVTFAFSGDLRNHAEYDVFDRIFAQRPDFFVSSGDFPYADNATTLEEYRAAHRLARDHATLQRFYRYVPIVPVWDDHEVANDWDATTPAINVQNGIAAWFDYMPVRGPREIYRSQRWGQLLELFLLDVRSHRDANAAPDLPGKTMLGQAQKDWLKAALRGSDATFKVVVTPVPLRYGKANKDHWNGFMRERAELLAWLQENGVQNVVFVSGDSHFASAHHHREGVREYQAGPMAAQIGVVSNRPEPEVAFRAHERSFGVIKVDGGATPKLHVELHGMAGVLYRETLVAAPAARLEVIGDAPEGRFHLQGPGVVRNSGAQVSVPRVEPGEYRALFAASADVDGVPADLLLSVPSGGDVRVGTKWRDRSPPAFPVLLEAPFERPLAGVQVFDDGTIDGPSAWFVDNGWLRQNSNIHDGRPLDPARHGTLAVLGNTSWTDYTLQVAARSEDDGAFGVVLRWRDAGNYYRFSWDAEHRQRRLVAVRGGQFTILAEDDALYESDRWYQVRFSAIGDRLKVVVDGTVVFDVRDRSVSAGAVGLYTCHNALAAFDDLTVRGGDTTDWHEPRLFRDDFEDGRVSGWTVHDHGTRNAPSHWLEWGGYLIQASAISDGQTNNDLPMLGTVAVSGQTTWTDYVLRAQLRNLDEGPIGLVFRWEGPDTYYRFLLDSRRQLRRLTKVVRGRWTLLHEDTGRTTPGRWYQLQIVARGSQLRVVVDSQLFVDVTDVSIPAGAVGAYCANSIGAIYDDYVVEQVAPQRAVLGAVLAGTATRLVGRSPQGAGQPYLLLLSLARTPPVPLSLLSPLDPRTIDLAADSLFFASVNLAIPGLRGTVTAAGDFGAPLPLPVIGGLSGQTFYCGGLVLDPIPGRILEVVPTVALRFP